MHSRNVNAGLWCEIPCGAEEQGQVARLRRSKRTMIDDVPIRCRRGNLMPVDRGEGPDDNRPRARVRGGLSGHVPGVEFGEGTVEVVGFEGDGRCELVICIDFEDDEYLYEERL